MKQYRRKEQWHDKCHFCCHHKVYKGRSRLIPVWLIPPTETPLPWSIFMPLYPVSPPETCLLDQIIQNSLQPSLNTMLSSPTVDIRTVSRHRIPSQHHRPECIWGPTSSVTLTDRLFRYIYLFSSAKFANHRYNKGVRGSMAMSGGLFDPPELWLILVSGGWHVITLAVTQERHRETDSQRLRRADTERWRQLWGDLKQCADWDIIYWYLLAGCGRIKDVLNYIRVSEVSIMSTRWNSFKWIFYLARIFSRQSSI